ncbi:DNA-binding protein [Kitasatospora cineracea]
MKIDNKAKDGVRTERGMTLQEVLGLPVTINVVTAARALGTGPNTAYEAIRNGNFPLDVITVGGSRRVLTASLWKLLGVEGHVSSGDV